MSRLGEIGIDGPLSNTARERLADLDVDAIHDIPLDGPWSAELLIAVAEVGARSVRDRIADLALEGPASDEVVRDAVRSLRA